jgi:Tol biopolymer transport system component
MVVSRTVDDDKPGDDSGKKAYRSEIWLSRDGQAAQPFTRAGVNASTPRFSPDGSLLAFTSSLPGEPAQLWVMPVDGGEARVLTSFKKGATSPTWHPDGSCLIVKSSGNNEDKRAEQGTPRVLERIDYKQNGLSGPGFRADTPAQLWLVDLQGQVEAITNLPTVIGDCAWLPDGSGIVFAAAKDLEQESTWAVELFVLDWRSKKTVQLTGWVHRGACGVSGWQVHCLSGKLRLLEATRRFACAHTRPDR